MFRPKRPRHRPHAFEMDDVGVTRRHEGVVLEHITWSDLRRVEVRTTSDGPWRDDVFWLLLNAEGDGVAVPSERVPEGLLARLRELPGWDHAAVIRAMGTATDGIFLCWDATGGHKGR